MTREDVMASLRRTAKALEVPQGFAKNSYDMAVAGMNNPNNSWLETGVYTALGTLVLPLAMVEELGRGLLNIPSAAVNAIPLADQAGMELAIAMDPRQTTDARIVAGLEATRDFAFAFTGLAGPATLLTPAPKPGAGMATTELTAGATAAEVRAGATAAEARAGAAAGEEYGVSFFGERNLKYYTGENVTLGGANKPAFYMPLEDAALVRDAGSAARYTGMAPSVERAYLAGEDVYGVSFPTKGMPSRVPTAADAAGSPHFLEGGQTAVRLPGEGGGYLLNPTREFVVPGGNPMPTGSVVFKLGPNGSWIPIRKF